MLSSDGEETEEIEDIEELDIDKGKDTPINRATVSMIATVDLEKELDRIRERRLELRQRIEKIAKVKGEKADLTSFIKFDKKLKATQEAMKKLDEQADKIQQAVNQLRVLVMEMED